MCSVMIKGGLIQRRERNGGVDDVGVEWVRRVRVMYGSGWGHSASETDAIVHRDILFFNDKTLNSTDNRRKRAALTALLSSALSLKPL